ncbi:putative Transglutaminase domain protein [metagenome]|uniref:Putative Transglutaminase domain protein n=1 Tax=metagenome TaxID=256318 RepID=A0A2P2BW78_9ZZZZ
MSRPRVALRHGLVFALVTGMTAWFTLFSWRGFSDSYWDYLLPLLALALLLPPAGAALRWLRMPTLLVPLVQLLLAGLVLVALFGNDTGAGHLPTPDAIGATVQAVRDAVETARGYASPVPVQAPSLAPLLVGCGVLAIVAVDLIAGGFGRVPASGLVLLVVYTLPVTIWGRSIAWSLFVVVAIGFLTMLFLREDERFSQWGRQITGDPDPNSPSGFGVRTGSARSNAMSMGAVATAAALVLPALVPTLDLSVFGFGQGSGSGSNVTIVNPMTDLRRDLKQGDDTLLLTVTTDQPNPTYLRYSVLTNFNGNEWTTGNRAIPGDQVADGHDLPEPQGLDADVQRTPYTAEYSTTDAFRSLWLPVPVPATNVEADGLWKYDVATMDFLSGDDEFASDLDYTAKGLDLDLTQEQLQQAGTPPGPLLEKFTALPDKLPTIVTRLAEQVTAGRSSDFERAVQLQDWFRTEGGFRYSLLTASGNGSNDLEAFLSTGPQGRVGYCEQFASAMAVMARTLDIPARVAVGFLRPDRVGADSYAYSSLDLHAWPELYFEGSGWVRFEPTPGGAAGRTGAAPAYTQVDLPAPVETAEPSASASGTSSQSTAPSNVKPTIEQDLTPGGAGAEPGFPWVRVLLVLLAVILLALLVMVPRTVRRLRREQRWRLGTAEAAWAELRDAAVDLGVPYPAGRSPRVTGDLLATQFAAPGTAVRPVHGRTLEPEASDALDRVVLALEIERYSPRPLETSPEALREDVTRCVVALRNGVSDRRRRQSEWYPRSLFRSSRAWAWARTDEVESVNNPDQVIEHVGS